MVAQTRNTETKNFQKGYLQREEDVVKYGCFKKMKGGKEKIFLKKVGEENE